ncbi:hypothetical protein H072_8183 [Dactylellina haptotyla CBS 200.50]|uniref:Profilin n=2 Tax=Dactylellina haptotyla TaxID=430498 RepID=S8BS79_DACHA|nr:profilin-like protein [Dactylellina haptotyla]EPS38087.1 hypothetical protein H072_8183 [Dactylellina haptotyla CBS 200.50]
MSWQAYVDTSLVSSGNVDQGAIFSAAGDSVWAATPGFAIQPAEVQKIVAAFSKFGNDSPLFSDGVHIAGTKYILISHEENLIMAKKGKEGMVITRTPQTIIFAHHPESIATPSARTTVEALADYLKKSNY